MTIRLIRLRRILALIRKEAIQVVRDPSSLIIAGLMPVLLLFLFGYGVSFDARRLPVGLVIEKPSNAAETFATSLRGAGMFDIQLGRDRRVLEQALVAGEVKALIVLPAAFGRLQATGEGARIQVIIDGTEANSARLITNYIGGVWRVWAAQERMAGGIETRPAVELVPRFWFNPEVSSHHYLVPGAIAMILTLIGALLTGLVIAREWERGTMEALLSTPIGVVELLLGKLVPYFILAMLSMALATMVAVLAFDVPFRGSIVWLAITGGVFTLASLGQGLLISSLTRSQFMASETTMLTAFLPAYFFSGFIFALDAMPRWVQWLSYVVPARYFVRSLQTLFLAGDVPSILWPSTAAMLSIAVVFLGTAAAKTRLRLD